MKWWLISDDDAEQVRLALLKAQASAGTGIMTTYQDALHTLESGLHQTDAVPGGVE